MAEKTYFKMLSEMLKTVEGFEKPRDRLASLSQMLQSRNMSVISSNNWMAWLNDAVFLDTLSEEQLERIRCFWNEIAKKMLCFDLEITKEVKFMRDDVTKRGMIGIEPT